MSICKEIFEKMIETCFRYLHGRVEYCKVIFIDGTFVADKLEGPGKVNFSTDIAEIVHFLFNFRLSWITKMFLSAILFKELFMDLQSCLIPRRN